MDFLKEILGEELYKSVEEKLNAYNGNEANKGKQVKLANLATGEYVSKAKHDALAEQITGKDTELKKATDLIAELKNGTKDNEGLQSKISGYETQVADLQAQLADTKLKSAVKVALLSEKAADVDYLTFKLNEKLKEKNETLELDENGNIKGWNDRLSGLKTQFPNMFEAAGSGDKKIDENKLKDGEGERGNEPKNLAEALKLQYEAKAKE